MDGRTDGRTEGRTDGRTDGPSFRDAMTHQKKETKQNETNKQNKKKKPCQLRLSAQTDWRYCVSLPPHRPPIRRLFPMILCASNVFPLQRNSLLWTGFLSPFITKLWLWTKEHWQENSKLLYPLHKEKVGLSVGWLSSFCRFWATLYWNRNVTWFNIVLAWLNIVLT